MAHTPERWWASHPHVDGNVDVYRQGGLIATVISGNPADASLIAAAPALLELARVVAAGRLAHELARIPPEDGLHDFEDRVCALARTTIADMEGA